MESKMTIALFFFALLAMTTGQAFFGKSNSNNDDGRYRYLTSTLDQGNDGRYRADDSGKYNPDKSGQYMNDNSGHYVYDGSGQYVEYAKPTDRIYDEAKLKQWCAKYKESGLYHYKYAISEPKELVGEECAKFFEEEDGKSEQFRVKGYYKYYSDDGKKYIIDYTADENGFIPDGNFLHPTLLAAIQYHKTQGKINGGEEAKPDNNKSNESKFKVFKGFHPYYFSKNPKIPNPKA